MKKILTLIVLTMAISTASATPSLYYLYLALGGGTDGEGTGKTLMIPDDNTRCFFTFTITTVEQSAG